MGLKVGDKVKILDVTGIDLADSYFQTGDEVEIVRIRGNFIGLKTDLIVDDTGLLLLEDEYKFVKKIK